MDETLFYVLWRVTLSLTSEHVQWSLLFLFLFLQFPPASEDFPAFRPSLHLNILRLQSRAQRRPLNI